VRVQEVGLDPARSANETDKQWRNEQRQPGAAPKIADHAMAVGDAEVGELLRPDDLDVDAARANVINRVRDEPSRRVAGRARVRRRQHRDAHQLSTRKTA
jgi:hypothetical protein